MKKIIYLIIVLAIILGGVYMWQKEAQAPVVTGNNQPVDWQTYKNDQYGFEFERPADWRGEINRGVPMPERMIRFDLMDPKEAGNVYFSLDLWLADQFHIGTRDWQPFQIGNLKGDISSSNGGYEIVINENGKVYYFWTRHDPNTDTITKHILSTFKLTK